MFAYGSLNYNKLNFPWLLQIHGYFTISDDKVAEIITIIIAHHPH